MNWTDIGFTVETPMFLRGGANQARAEFRLPSLRGVMRFWFRALAGEVFSDDQTTVEREEARLFGSASDGGGGSSSSLLFRKGTSPGHTSGDKPGWLTAVNQPRLGVGYLLGPGFYDHPGGLKQPSRIEPGSTGSFSVRSRAGDTKDLRLAGVCLAVLSRYGGLGARTRRGFGGIRFTGLGELDEGLDRDVNAENPSELLLDRFADAVGAQRPAGAIGTATFAPIPSFTYWAQATRTPAAWTSWESALDCVGRSLRSFRAPVDRTQPPFNRSDLPPYRQKVTQEYVDIVAPQPPGKVRPPQADFPLAAFGLPIVFSGDQTVTLRRGAEELRRSSPLFVRPWRTGDRQWAVTCHVFKAKLWDSGANLALTAKAGPVNVTLTLDEQTAYQKLDAWLASPW